jgi:hypothetical protein
LLLELARRAAEAQIDLIRIWRARHDLFVRNLKHLPRSPETDSWSSAVKLLEILDLVDDPLTESPGLAKLRDALLKGPRDHQAIRPPAKSEPSRPHPQQQHKTGNLDQHVQPKRQFAVYKTVSVDKDRVGRRKVVAKRRIATMLEHVVRQRPQNSQVAKPWRAIDGEKNLESIKT